MEQNVILYWKCHLLPVPVAAPFKACILGLITYWDRGFESSWLHIYVSTFFFFILVPCVDRGLGVGRPPLPLLQRAP